MENNIIIVLTKYITLKLYIFYYADLIVILKITIYY